MQVGGWARRCAASAAVRPKAGYDVPAGDDSQFQKSNHSGGAVCYLCGLVGLAFVFGGIAATALLYWHYSPILSRTSAEWRHELDTEMATADKANNFLLARNTDMVKRMTDTKSRMESYKVKLSGAERAEDDAVAQVQHLKAEEQDWHDKFQALSKRAKQDEKAHKDLDVVGQIEAQVGVQDVQSFAQRVQALMRENQDLRTRLIEAKEEHAELAEGGAKSITALQEKVSSLQEHVVTLQHLNHELIQDHRHAENLTSVWRHRAEELSDKVEHLEAQLDQAST